MNKALSSGSPVIRTLLFMATAASLALPASQSRAPIAAPFGRVQIDGAAWAAVLGDIDGDGYPDMAAALGHQVYWYAYPTWSKHLISSHDGPENVRLADINNDGNLDVVTASGGGTDGIAWYENPKSHGGNPATDSWARHTIQNPVQWHRAHDLLASDLNGDGKVDVVIRVEAGPTYVYLQNDPDSWTAVLLTNASDGEGMALLDVNRDGKLDIVENGYWLEQPSDPLSGNWSRHDFAAWPADSRVTIGDVNNDGRPDVVLTPEKHAGQISWFEQPPDPITGSWTEHIILAVDRVQAVGVGDFNKDGTIDLCFAEGSQSGAKRFGILYNQRAGTSWSLQVLAATGGENIAIEDVQADGDLDILNNATSGVELWRNDMNTALALDSWHYVQIDGIRSTGGVGLNFGDIDGDGRSDIVSGRYWYRNPGGDLTANWTRFELPPGMDGMLAVDADSDGHVDILAEGPINGRAATGVYWLRNNGRGTGWSPVLIGELPRVPADFDGQGYVLASIIGRHVPEIILTSGLGAYYFEVPANPFAGNWPRTLISPDIAGKAIAAADINHDGKPDVVGFADRGGTLISWWENPGTGAAGWVRHDVGVTSGSPGGRIAVADLDHDGRPDIIVSEANLTASHNSLIWFAQPADLRDGTWIRRTIAADQGSLNSMDVADVNGDGNMDVITGEYRGSLSVSVWENVSNATRFAQHIVDTGQESFLGARVVDLNRDGAPDIVSIARDRFPLLHLWRNDALWLVRPAAETSFRNNHVSTGAASDPTASVTSAVSTTTAPTLVQHVSGSNAQQQVTFYNLPLPNKVLPGNCVIVGVRKDADNATVTVTDDQGNVYIAGPRASDGAKSVALYYSLNITNAPGAIRVSFSGQGSYWVSVVATEFYNVAAASAADSSNGNSGSGASLTTNNIATTVDGDLIYHYAAVSADDTSTEMSSWTPGSGYTLLSADLFDKDAAQYTIQATHGTINPSMTMSPSNGWLSVGMALKPAAGGTAPRPGIHVDKVLHNGIPVGWSSKTARVQVPSTGNLLVAIFASEPSATITGISDTAGHAWTSTGPDVNAGSSISGMQYVANASASNTNVVTYTYAVAVGGGDTCIVFDISGADPAAPFDKRGTASGDQLTGTSYTGASVTPATSNGLLISVNAVESNTVTAVLPETLIASTTTPETSPWPDDENNGYAIQYNVNTSTITSSWTSDGPVGGWTEILGAFKAPATPPTVNITAPASGAMLTGTITVSATASSNVGMAGVQFQLDGANLGAEVTVPPYSISWNTTTATNGSHTLTAIARDTFGNHTTSSPVNVTVDTIPPSVSLTSPANGAFVTGTITVSATASDNVGVVGVQFQLDGTNLGAEVTVAPYAVSWNTATVTNGSHTLTAIALDAAGNKTTSGAVTVTVDAIPPTVSLTSPANAAFVTGTITVSATASDNVGVAGVQFQLDGANLGAEVTAAPYSVSWDTTTATNGSHALAAIARDAAGNKTTSSAVTVTVDAIPPAISLTSPANGVFVAGTIAVSATASDNVGVVGVQFQLDGANLGAEVTAAPYSISWNPATTTTGSHTLTAIARDAAGNRTTSSAVTVTVDTIPPTVSMTSPGNGAFVMGTIAVSATASDNVGVVGVQFQLDGANLGVEVTAAPYSVPWDTTTAANGSHTLTAIARDAAGNKTTSSALTVTVDTIPPTVSTTNPGNGAFVTGTIAVSAAASDNLGVVGVQFQLDGLNLGAEVTLAPYAVLWNTTSATNGLHALTAIARDAAGNKTTSSAVTVTVDTIPPTVSVTGPANGATVSGTITVSATASDNVAVAGVQFKLDGANLGLEVTSAPYGIAWNSTNVTDGTHTLTAAARDAAGNTTTSTPVTVQVANSLLFLQAAGISSDGADTTISQAFSAVTNAGSLIVAAVSWLGAGVLSCSDSQANTYAAIPVVYDSINNQSLGICYAANIPGGADAVTATFNGSFSNRRLLIHEYKGVAANTPIDVTAQNIAAGTTQSDNITTTQGITTAAGDLIFGVVMDESGVNAIQAGTNFTLRSSVDAADLASEDRVQGAAGGVAATWTFSAPHSYLAQMVAFRPLGPGPDNIPPTVSITAPASGATLTGTIAVSATASDNVGVVGVQFQLDGANLGAEAAAPPYSVSWDTTTATNGSHTLTAIARDAAGNKATSSAVTVTVDAIAPTVSMTSPANSAAVTGTITVSATASDNVGVAGVQFQLDGANLGAEVTAPPYSVSWDTTTATNGSHTLTAIARDVAGNKTTSSAVTVTVDAIAPTVSMTSPANGASVTGTITVSATASDNVGVVGVQFQLDGVNLGAEVTTPPYSVSWDTTVAANGSHTLTAIARDAAGNKTTSSAVTVTVDAIAPTVSVTSPANGASVTGTITVSATASDNVGVVGVQFQLDGANLGTEVTAAPYSVSWNTTTATNGSHTLTAIARDAAGNKTTASAVTVTVDAVPPAVSLTSPANGAFVTGTITVSATASDNVGVAGVQFQLDGANLGAEVTAAPYSVSWNTTTATNGSHKLTAVARDAAGNKTTSSAVTVTVDTVPPTVSVSNPANGAFVTGMITVSATASDNVGVAGVQFQLDGANLAAEVTAAPYTVSWNATTATNGSHTLTAIARDAAGNKTTSNAVTVVVDTIPPAVSITSPANGATVSGTVTVSATASDNVGVIGVQFQLDGANLGSEVTAAPYSVPWNTTTATNGSHTLTAIARDAAGNRTTSTPVAVTVNNVIVAFAQGSGTTNDSGSRTIAQTFPAATAAGDLIVAAISWGSNATVGCSDSQGNTYAVATTQYDSINKQSLAICYATNIKGGADTVTATFSATASFRRLLIHEYRGIALTGAVDVVAKNLANGSTTANAVTSTAATATATGDLVFGAVMDDAGVNNITAGTGFIPRQSVNNKDLFSEDLTKATSGSIAATFTFSAAHRYLAQMVTFKHR